MSNVKFTKQELRKFVAHYTKEKQRLEGELEIVNSMLSKLTGYVSNVGSVKPQVKPTGKLTAKGEKPKKRGPKSIWGKFIVARLRARQKPMSYDELLQTQCLSKKSLSSVNQMLEQAFLMLPSD